VAVVDLTILYPMSGSKRKSNQRRSLKHDAATHH